MLRSTGAGTINLINRIAGWFGRGGGPSTNLIQGSKPSIIHLVWEEKKRGTSALSSFNAD